MELNHYVIDGYPVLDNKHSFSLLYIIFYELNHSIVPIYTWLLSLLMAFVQFPSALSFHFAIIYIFSSIMEWWKLKKVIFGSNCQRFIDCHQKFPHRASLALFSLPKTSFLSSPSPPRRRSKTKWFQTFNKLFVKLIVFYTFLLTHLCLSFNYEWKTLSHQKTLLSTPPPIVNAPLPVFTSLPCDIIKCL